MKNKTNEQEGKKERRKEGSQKGRNERQKVGRRVGRFEGVCCDEGDEKEAGEVLKTYRLLMKEGSYRVRLRLR